MWLEDYEDKGWRQQYDKHVLGAWTRLMKKIKDDGMMHVREYNEDDGMMHVRD